MEPIHLAHTPVLQKTEILLPSSKSESNRALIINTLAGGHGKLTRLSEARDTQTMIRLLASNEKTLDVLDAGTTMRFLAAYFAIGNQEKTLTGTARMQQRPIKVLVKALKKIGASIKYLHEKGYPPIRIKPFKGQKTNQISINGSISSQYISALLMIAPTLPQGLSLTLEGEIGSKPYIQMTIDLMAEFGVKAEWYGNTIQVGQQPYQSTTHAIEPDWSAASYWYSFVALAKEAEIKLIGLKQKSLQGDIAISKMMNELGVMSAFEQDGVLLKKIPHKRDVSFDFTDCPDLAQTIAVTCAAKGIHCQMTGLESLRIKETDRIAALKKELKKFKTKLKETSPGIWELKPKFFPNDTPITIETYDDHRMAMAFAPMATQQPIIVNNPSVVEKSYPRFWEDLEKTGISSVTTPPAFDN